MARPESSGVSHSSVEYSFFCPDVGDRFDVLRFRVVESLSRPFRLVARLIAFEDHSDCAELLSRSVRFTLDRGSHLREFYGIVDSVTLGDEGTLRQSCEIVVLPALAALRLTLQTRIFQDQSALSIIESVIEEGLRPYDRTLSLSSLDAADFATRDYCVQYQETDLDFVHRLLLRAGEARAGSALR